MGLLATQEQNKRTKLENKLFAERGCVSLYFLWQTRFHSHVLQGDQNGVMSFTLDVKLKGLASLKQLYSYEENDL